MSNPNEPDNLPEVPQEPIARMGMFGAQDSGDTSGYGRLVVRRAPRLSTPAPTAATSTPSRTSWSARSAATSPTRSSAWSWTAGS
nr:hypothetical protein GCM10020093_082350 [Planobispora longispora]